MGYNPSGPWERESVPDGDASGDMVAHFQKQSESRRGRTVQPFASTAARDAAFAGLTSDQKKGAISFVDGAGWFGFTGSAWRPFSMEGYTFQHGLANVVTDENGLFGINHTLGATNVGIQLTPVYGGPAGAAEDVMDRVKLEVREFQYNGVICHATDVQVGPGVGAPLRKSALIVSYRIERIVT